MRRRGTYGIEDPAIEDIEWIEQDYNALVKKYPSLKRNHPTISEEGYQGLKELAILKEVIRPFEDDG